MKAPRDLARARTGARPLGRLVAPPVPALAGHAAMRDLADLDVWENSIRRSRMRRDARERQLNFGPVTGRRVAVPIAVLAAGVLARDALSGDGHASGSPVFGAERAAATSAHHGKTRPSAKHRAGAGASQTPAAQGPATRAVTASQVQSSGASHAKSPGASRSGANASAHAAKSAATPARPKERPAKTRVGDELVRGDHGPAVARLQSRIGVTPDGFFGPQTLHAVKAFQRHRELAVDGRVGPQTWSATRTHSALGESSAKVKTAAAHHTHGDGVRALQAKVGVPVDGVFGKQTAHAVRAFQHKHGLKADGIVGPATWQAMGVDGADNVLRQRHARAAHEHAHSSRGHVAHKGGRAHMGTSVRALQSALGVPVDGDFGRQTKIAVKAFQRRHGLKADGVVGPATWAALGVPSAHRVLREHSAHVSHVHRRSSGGGGGGGGGAGSGALARAIAAANAIATKPYRWGGGHGSFNDSGYDCSGSVSYVLHAAGVLSSPLDSTGLMSYGEPGPGRYITIYANSGHAFMTINGRRFDTGWGGEGNRWASGSRPTSGFVVRHPPGL